MLHLYSNYYKDKLHGFWIKIVTFENPMTKVGL